MEEENEIDYQEENVQGETEERESKKLVFSLVLTLVCIVVSLFSGSFVGVLVVYAECTENTDHTHFY